MADKQFKVVVTETLDKVCADWLAERVDLQWCKIDDGMPLGELGTDCTANAECVEDYCLMFESNGEEFGFCSRQCVKAEDCPEDGWVCNLSPYTACVPG